jgi:hypothetical protein
VVTTPVFRPVLMLQTPCSMIEIAAAPLASRYATARFLFGAFASMGNVDTGIRSRRQKHPLIYSRDSWQYLCREVDRG